MTVQQGSIGWTMGTLTASQLRTQASLVSSFVTPGDEEFTLTLALALRYWNVNAALLGDAFGVSVESVNRWAAGLNLPKIFARKNILEWIADDLDRRAEAIESMLNSPPPEPAEQNGQERV